MSPTATIENPKSSIENPPALFTLLLGRPHSGKTRLALQIAAAATRGTLHSADPTQTLLPPAAIQSLPSAPVPVLLVNHSPDQNATLLSFNPDTSLLFVATVASLIPTRRRAHPGSPDHPLSLLASQLADDPPIRLIIIHDLPKLVGHQARTLVPALLALARQHNVPIIVTAPVRSRPYPFARLAGTIHTLPSGRWRHSRPPRSPMRRDNLLTEAINLFQSQLAAGPQYAELFLDLAVGKYRISTSTVYRAKRLLGIESFGPHCFSQWRLPNSHPRALSPIHTPSVDNGPTPQRTDSPIYPLPADNGLTARALSAVQSPSTDNGPTPQRTDSPIQSPSADNGPTPQRTDSPIYPLPADNGLTQRTLSPIHPLSADNGLTP